MDDLSKSKVSLNNFIEEIEIETLSLFREVKLKSEKRKENEEEFKVSFLNPSADQVILSRKICRKFDNYSKEILRFFNNAPFNNQNISELIARNNSYILFDRIGKNLDGNTWGKLFIKELACSP